MKKRILVVIAGVLALSCRNAVPTAPTPPSQTQANSQCSVVGNNNNVNCLPPTGATPTPTPGLPVLKCVAQTAPFTCGPGTAIFASIVSAAQANLPPAVESVYVAALVTELNKINGLCASTVAGSPDEISVKSGNDRSETYDVVRADGAPHTLFVNACLPSRF